MNQYDSLRAVRALGVLTIPGIRCVLCDAPLDEFNESDTCPDCYHITTDALAEES